MSTTTPLPPSPFGPAPYPATLKVDYPDRKLNRLTSFFRIFVAIPILIVAGLIIYAGVSWPEARTAGWHFSYQTGAFVFLPTLLMLLFRKKYPKWWFDWNLALMRFGTRLNAYIFLLRDEYPSTDEEQAIHLDLQYPDAQTQLMRGMPLVKWFLAIPHYVVLIFLGVAAFICLVIAWFAILFTGRYPRSLFDFIVGYFRWEIRVAAYMLLLVTDRYPPFSMSP
jgi:hypothetical protein